MTSATHETAVSIENLVKLYAHADHPAVDGLNLEVRSGTIFGLLGPNGAGKTTTISILCTLLQPTSGRVSILNQDVVRQSDAVRRLIGFVPQDIALYSSLTALENLEYFARILRIPGHRIKERISHCLQLVGLEDYANRRIDSYSGGMKRRINLAAGVMHEPQILFLDEPTVGIDAQSRNLIFERLITLKEAGMTLFYTTHYMEEAAQLCDEIAIIDSGRMLSCGAPQQLVAEKSDCENLDDLFLALTGKKLRD